MPEPRELDVATFDAFVAAAGQLAALVYFHAPWCAPCLAMAGSLRALAAQWVGVVGFAAVDVDDQPALASRFDVDDVPTFVLFAGGQPVARCVGYQPVESMRLWLRRSIEH